MSTTFKQEWHALKRGQVGHRFAARYAAGKKAREKSNWTDQIGRIVRLVIALAFLVVGVVLVFIPGPAILFFFLSGGLLASESKYIARFLDWSELQVRAGWSWSKRHWKALPTWGKVLVTTFAAAIALAAAFVAYRMFTN